MQIFTDAPGGTGFPGIPLTLWLGSSRAGDRGMFLPAQFGNQAFYSRHTFSQTGATGFYLQAVRA